MCEDLENSSHSEDSWKSADSHAVMPGNTAATVAVRSDCQPLTFHGRTDLNAELFPGARYFRRLQSWLMIAFAVSLSLPITVPWIVLIVGMCTSLLALLIGRRGIEQPISDIPYLPSISTPSGGLAKPPLTLPLAAFTLALTISSAVAAGAVGAGQALLSLRGFLVYFWAYHCFRSDTNLSKKAVLACLMTSGLAGLWATFQQLSGFHIGYQYLQGTGFLSGPMAFAGEMQIFSSLATALLFTGAFRRFDGPFKTPLLFGLITMANLLGLIFASERSAWLGGIAGMMSIALVCSWPLILASMATLSAFSALAWFYIPVFQKRLLPLLHWQSDVSTRARLQVWQEAWHIFQKSPILGIGNKFPHLYIREALVPGRSSYLDHAHSNYLHILATGGLLGFAAYLWLQLSAARLSWQQMNRKDRHGTALSSMDEAIALGILGSLISLAVSGLFEYNFGTGQVRLSQWFFMALLIGRLEKRG